MNKDDLIKELADRLMYHDIIIANIYAKVCVMVYKLKWSIRKKIWK